MPKRNGKKPQRKGKRKGPGQQYTSINGPWGTKLQIPIPRIPRTIGAAQALSAKNSVYPYVNLDFPISPMTFNIGTGAIAAVQNMDTSLVANFATRVTSLFNEYAIVGLLLEFRVNQVLNPSGFATVFLDEKGAAAPTLAESRNTPHLEVAIITPSTQRVQLIRWKAEDLLDLNWTDTSVNSIPLYLKIFASIAGTSTLANTSCQVLVTGAIALCLRGYAI